MESAGAASFIAIIFTILGCFFSALSLILMKYALEKSQRDANAATKSPYLTKSWIFGFISLLLGSVCNIFAISQGNLTLLASSSSITIIFNTILSVKILQETFSRYDLLAIVLIMLGCALCVSISKNDETGVFDLQMLTEFSSITFIVVSLIYIYFVIWYDRVIRRVTWKTYFKIEQIKPVQIKNWNGFDISPQKDKSASIMTKTEDLSFEEEKSPDRSQQKFENKSLRKLTANLLENLETQLDIGESNKIHSLLKSRKCDKVQMLLNQPQQKETKDDEKSAIPNMRNIITVFSSLTRQQCLATDEPSLLWLKSRIKLPMFLMGTACGLMSSLSMTFLKFFTETLKVEGILSPVVYIYFIFSITISSLQLKMLNRTMEVYDQIETVPIYQTSLILLNIACGSIVMNERMLYSWDELSLMVVYSTISICGVWIILKKPASDDLDLPVDEGIGEDKSVISNTYSLATATFNHGNINAQLQIRQLHRKPEEDQRDILNVINVIRNASSAKHQKENSESSQFWGKVPLGDL